MPPPRRRRAAALLALSSAIAAAACNLLTGEHDRFLRGDVDAPAPPPPDAASSPAGDAGTPDAFDAAPDVFVINTGAGALWLSPNGAQWEADEAGTRITALGTGTGRDHAVIFPNRQPDIPSDDYSVEATVHVTSPLIPLYPEFGVLARVLDGGQLNDDAGALALLSSAFGGGDQTWLGTMGPPEWSPLKLTESPGTHPAGGERRYRLVLHARGANVTGRMWDVSGPDPGIDEVFYGALRPTGRGIGFYTYGVVTAWLEDMRVTVP